MTYTPEQTPVIRGFPRHGKSVDGQSRMEPAAPTVPRAPSPIPPSACGGEQASHLRAVWREAAGKVNPHPRTT